MTKSPALTLFSIALAARALMISFALYGHRGAPEGALTRYFLSSDAPSYVAVARTLMTGVRDANEWHERVFLGWPLTLALPGALVGYELACLVLAALLAAFVPVVFWKLTQHRAASLALALLTPTWLMHSSLGMSEPVFLLCQLGAIWACVQARGTLGSALAAASMVVRPNGVFTWIALAYAYLRERAWPRLAVHSVFAALAIALVVSLNTHFYGDALRQSHLYSGLPNVSAQDAAAVTRLPFSKGHLSVPLLHLVATPFVVKVPLWKIGFVWAHALLVFAACAVGVRELRATGFRRALWPRATQEDARTQAIELHTMMLIWALLSTAFILCTGPYWGFHTFDRYCVWALPAYLYLARDYLPKRDGVWLALGALSIALAMWSQSRSF